jgi:hypothetical protein
MAVRVAAVFPQLFDSKASTEKAPTLHRANIESIMADSSPRKAEKKEVQKKQLEHGEIPQHGCGILGRYPVSSVLIFAGTYPRPKG